MALGWYVFGVSGSKEPVHSVERAIEWQHYLHEVRVRAMFKFVETSPDPNNAVK